VLVLLLASALLALAVKVEPVGCCCNSVQVIGRVHYTAAATS
jgi:hypothetical protein